MVVGARRPARRPLFVLALLAALAAAAGADVLFHVPEVLVHHAAAPRPVGTGRNLNKASTVNKANTANPGGNASAATAGGKGDLGDPQRNESAPWPPRGDALQQRHEYFIEHSISTTAAKKMAAMIILSEEPESLRGCGACSKREMEYCETKVMADHCCCDRHYMPEPFPWLPHTCYLGPDRCAPLASDCAHYARLRDCCCVRKLAEHFRVDKVKATTSTAAPRDEQRPEAARPARDLTSRKGILSGTSQLSATGVGFMLVAAVLFTLYL